MRRGRSLSEVLPDEGLRERRPDTHVLGNTETMTVERPYVEFTDALNT